MGNKFFIDKQLEKKIVKDLDKRAKIEEKINKYQEQLNNLKDDLDNDLEEFNSQIDKSTVISTLKYSEEHGGCKQKVAVEQIRERFLYSRAIKFAKSRYIAPIRYAIIRAYLMGGKSYGKY